MKSATEAASFSQPPSNASLMTPSDYRLWQLSLNSGQAARSQANEEVEEAWGYVASGAEELTIEHLRIAADAMLGQSKYSAHELIEALVAINKGRKAKSITATKQEFIAFIHATQNSQLDAEDSMTRLRQQQALQGSSSSSSSAPQGGKALDLISIGNMKLADFFMAYRRRSFMQLYMKEGLYFGAKGRVPSSSISSTPQADPTLPRKAPCPTLNPNPNDNPKPAATLKPMGPIRSQVTQSERRPLSLTRFQDPPGLLEAPSVAGGSQRGPASSTSQPGPLQAPSPDEPSSPFESAAGGSSQRGPASSTSQSPTLPQINTSASIHPRRSMGALPISSSKRFTTMTDLMNDMGNISLLGGSQRGASMMRQSQGGRSGLGSDDATDGEQGDDEEDLFPLRQALVRHQEADDGIVTLHQLRKAAALNASMRRSEIAMHSSPAVMPRAGSESSMKGLTEAEAGSILGLQGRSQSQNLVLPYILQEASSPSLSRAGSQDLDSPSPCRRKREGLSNLSPLLRQPPSKSQVLVASDQALDSKRKLERFRSKRESSEKGLFEEQEVSQAVRFPREHFQVLMAGPPPSMGYYPDSRGGSFSGQGSMLRQPSMIRQLSTRKVSISSSVLDDGVGFQ